MKLLRIFDPPLPVFIYHDFFNPNNAFDAQGLTKLTEEIEMRRKQRNVIERDTDRDYYLDAKGAVEYGLVDQVLEVPEQVK